VISLSQIPLPDNTQHSRQTDIHAPGGIRTHNLSRRTAVDQRLRPRGHWDRQGISIENNSGCPQLRWVLKAGSKRLGFLDPKKTAERCEAVGHCSYARNANFLGIFSPHVSAYISLCTRQKDCYVLPVNWLNSRLRSSEKLKKIEVASRGLFQHFDFMGLLYSCPNKFPHSSPEAPRIIQMRETSTSESGNSSPPPQFC
jgi:hypothetical protein